jgi:hypothetical protein
MVKAFNSGAIVGRLPHRFSLGYKDQLPPVVISAELAHSQVGH